MYENIFLFSMNYKGKKEYWSESQKTFSCTYCEKGFVRGNRLKMHKHKLLPPWLLKQPGSLSNSLLRRHKSITASIWTFCLFSKRSQTSLHTIWAFRLSTNSKQALILTTRLSIFQEFSYALSFGPPSIWHARVYYEAVEIFYDTNAKIISLNEQRSNLLLP